MADDCSVPSRCRGSLFLPVTAEICYVISRLWSLTRCPGWAVPVSVALLGCPRGSGWMQCPRPQHSRRSCCPSEGAKQTALRKERAEQSRRHGSSRLLRSQALGLCSIKALVISGWGSFREQAGLGRGWKSAGSWDQGWKRRQGIGLGGSSRTDRPPASCPNLHYPDIEDFLLYLSSVTTFASCPCADKIS